MKQAFFAFYTMLNGNEKKAFGFGVIVFAIGFLSTLYLIRPKTWLGWAETSGELLGVKSMVAGQFSAGTSIYLLQFQSADGQIRQGTFKMSPIVLSTIKQIRVFYQKNDPSVFFVHNPTFTPLAITMMVFGAGVLVAFYLYNRDRLQGITYDD
jgi:hypothetical protein